MSAAAVCGGVGEAACVAPKLLRDAEVPEVIYQIVEVPHIIKQNRIVLRHVEQTVEVPVPMVVEEVVHVPVIQHQKRTHHIHVEQEVDIHVPCEQAEFVHVPPVVPQNRSSHHQIEQAVEIPKPIPVIHQQRPLGQEEIVNAPVVDVPQVHQTERSNDDPMEMGSQVHLSVKTVEEKAAWLSQAVGFRKPQQSHNSTQKRARSSLGGVSERHVDGQQVEYVDNRGHIVQTQWQVPMANTPQRHFQATPNVPKAVEVPQIECVESHASIPVQTHQQAPTITVQRPVQMPHTEQMQPIEVACNNFQGLRMHIDENARSEEMVRSMRFLEIPRREDIVHQRVSPHRRTFLDKIKVFDENAATRLKSRNVRPNFEQGSTCVANVAQTQFQAVEEQDTVGALYQDVRQGLRDVRQSTRAVPEGQPMRAPPRRTPWAWRSSPELGRIWPPASETSAPSAEQTMFVTAPPRQTSQNDVRHVSSLPAGVPGVAEQPASVSTAFTCSGVCGSLARPALADTRRCASATSFNVRLVGESPNRRSGEDITELEGTLERKSVEESVSVEGSAVVLADDECTDASTSFRPEVVQDAAFALKPGLPIDSRRLSSLEIGAAKHLQSADDTPTSGSSTLVRHPSRVFWFDLAADDSECEEKGIRDAALQENDQNARKATCRMRQRSVPQRQGKGKGYSKRHHPCTSGGCTRSVPLRYFRACR